MSPPPSSPPSPPSVPLPLGFTELTFEEELEAIDEESKMDAFDNSGDAFIGEPGQPGSLNDPAMEAARQAAIDAANGDGGTTDGDDGATGDGEE